MDKKLFEQKLSEVAEWQIPKTLATVTEGSRGRGRPSKEQQYQELREQMFLEEFDGVNPTFPPQIIKLKCTAETCGDCGKICEQGRHLEKKLYEANRKPHWRQKCVNCGCFQNPYTGKFDLKGSRASQIWNNFVRDTKGVYNSKGNRVRNSSGSEINE